ncbi:MAG: SpaA isopeptide-forming pilin-related protein [Oscillospiraceae bacterium]
MKTSFIRKGVSVLTALLMCLSVFAGTGVTPVSAAGEKATVYMVDYPREGSNTAAGTWGHGVLQLMNGWASDFSEYTMVRAMDSYEGNICYCIEPGVAQQTGDTYTQWDESFWESYPSDYNQTITASNIKRFIGRIMQYGYAGTISTDWCTGDDNGDKLAEAIATQLLIWETVVGERDEDFNKVSTGSKDAVLDQISVNHPLRTRILSHYNSIARAVQNHTRIPSFFSKTTAKAQNVDLEWNGSQYTATLTDANGVLDDYAFSASESGISFSVNGNKLTISAKAAPAGAVTITASKKNSQRRGIITWGDGHYNTDGSLQDMVTYAQSISDPVNGYLQVRVSYGSARIVKTSEDGIIAGIRFTVAGNGISETVTTGKNGEIQLDNLTPGVYTVTEQSYDKYEPQETRRITVIGGQTATVTFSNVLKRGSLTVIKTAEDGLNAGVRFRLSGTSLSGLPVNAYAVTNSSGTAIFEDVLIGSGYMLEEVDTAIRYAIPADQTAAVEWNKVTNKSFNNTLKKFRVTVTKSDEEAGTAQGGASLAGAVYGIYNGGQLVDTYTTDANGRFTTAEYICGDDWTLREIKPSEGYLLDTSVHLIGAEERLYTAEHNSTANDVTEQIIKGNIAIIKHTDNGNTQIETPETGAEFEVYLKSAGSYKAAKASERDILTCDENGLAQSKDLPYGVYTVHQTKGWDGRERMQDFDVFINSDGRTYQYLINNANFAGYLRIVKKDAETGKTIPYAGAGFQIYDPDGNLVKMTMTYPEITAVDTFYTSENGTLVTPQTLEYGRGYSLVEVQSPYGYVINAEPIHFDVTLENSAEESGITVIEVTRSDIAQKGIISVTKTGEVFSSVTAVGGGHTDENGNDIALPNTYQPVYTAKGLAGAVYEITAAEDIVTPDGTLRASKGEVVDTITTGKDGLAVTKELYLGKYDIREITAPFGMVLNSETQLAELTYAGQDVKVTSTASSFHNERQKVQIALSKVLEQDEKFGIGMNGEITSVSFGLYAAEDITAADGTAIPSDGLIEAISVNADGTAKFTADLPFGSYYVKELSANAAYIPSETKYPVQFEYSGQDTTVVNLSINNGEAIENKLIRGEIKGIKKTEDGNALSGAVIGLFKADETVFTAETAILTSISGEDGSFSFADVPYGSYIIREIEAPTGFVLTETVFPAVIDKDGAVIEIELINNHIRGNVSLTKADADYPDNHLTGAVFEVFADTNGNGEFEEEDALIGTMTEQNVGVYEMSDLIYGGYFVKEKTAPLGFIRDETAYYFTITEDGKTVTVENEAGKGFVNAAQKANLKIVKTSSDGRVEGFSFRVVGEHYDQAFKTDAKGEIFIGALRVGKYTVTELEDDASAGYVRPDPVTVELAADETLTVNVHNVKTPTDVPKTGDTSELWLWFSLTGLCTAGIAVTILAFRRKKHTKNSR